DEQPHVVTRGPARRRGLFLFAKDPPKRGISCPVWGPSARPRRPSRTTAKFVDLPCAFVAYRSEHSSYRCPQPIAEIRQVANGQRRPQLFECTTHLSTSFQ